jgi:uncharacterized protein (TIGR04141 family)
MPEVIDWADIDAFTISGLQGLPFDDLDLDAYLAHLGPKVQTSPSSCCAAGASQFASPDGDFDKRWTLYQGLISEQHLDSKLYVLIEGSWFSVSETLVEEVDSSASGLTPGSSPP